MMISSEVKDESDERDESRGSKVEVYLRKAQ
jgi:hypothetical protein